MTWRFPIFVTEKDERVTEVIAYDSTEEIEQCLEEIDIENEEYLAWDSEGKRLSLRIEHREHHWLRVTPTGLGDMDGLRTAIRGYAEAFGLPPEVAEGCTLAEAVRRIEGVEECPDRERRGNRRWYEFWRKR